MEKLDLNAWVSVSITNKNSTVHTVDQQKISKTVITKSTIQAQLSKKLFL